MKNPGDTAMVDRPKPISKTQTASNPTGINDRSVDGESKFSIRRAYYKERSISEADTEFEVRLFDLGPSCGPTIGTKARAQVRAYFVNVSEVILLFIRYAMRRASSKVVPSFAAANFAICADPNSVSLASSYFTAASAFSMSRLRTVIPRGRQSRLRPRAYCEMLLSISKVSTISPVAAAPAGRSISLV
jgi:hypothetical protein